GAGGQQLHVLVQGRRVVVDRVEAEVGPGHPAQLLVALPGQAALGVLHDDHRVDPEDVGGQGQAPQDVVGHPAAGVADDVGLPQLQAADGEDVDAGVHAGDDGQVEAGPG